MRLGKARVRAQGNEKADQLAKAGAELGVGIRGWGG